MRPGRSGAVLAAVCAVAIAAFASGCAASQQSFASGCAASQQSSTGTTKGATASDDMVCAAEPVTGSHIVETRCEKRSDIEERRAADRAAMDKMLINGNRPVTNGQAAGNTGNPQ